MSYVNEKTISDKSFVGNIYNKDVLSILKKLEKEQDYKELSENDIEVLNDNLSYGDLSFKQAWGSLNKEQYNSVTFIKGVITQIDSIDTIKKNYIHYVEMEINFILKQAFISQGFRL